MKRFAPLFFTMSMLGCLPANKMDYQIQVVSTRDNADSLVYLSDPGIRITVAWKNFKPKAGTVTLFDGSDNPVFNSTYPTPFNEMIVDTGRVIQYQFNPQDKPGSWRLVMVFDGEEVVHHRFQVSPMGEVPPVYQSLNCKTAGGEIILANLFQLSVEESETLKAHQGEWSWNAMLYEFRKRVTLCQAPELTAYQMDFWEQWLLQLTGKNVRQANPAVHERIEAVMPSYANEFLFVDPAFIDWFSSTYMPEPGATQVNGWVYQEIYHRTIRESARNLALTYLYYNSLTDEGLDAQVQYATMMARYYYNKEEERIILRKDLPEVYKFVSEWHETAANEWVANHIGKEIHGQAPYAMNTVDMAFWLRRGIDGSAYMVWMALREVLKLYDTAWYKLYIDPHWAP